MRKETHDLLSDGQWGMQIKKWPRKIMRGLVRLIISYMQAAVRQVVSLMRFRGIICRVLNIAIDS